MPKNIEYNSTSLIILPQDRGQYQSFSQFVTANSYSLEIQDDDTHAWDVYKHTVDHSSEQGAAILYKLADLSLHLTESARTELGDGKDLKASGRQYHPNKHTWRINSAWLLAQMHIGRPFTLVSTLSADYVMRSHPTRPNSISALAKEIAAVSKIYQFSGITSKGFIELTPKLHICVFRSERTLFPV
jgi:hypothetical protein